MAEAQAWMPVPAPIQRTITALLADPTSTSRLYVAFSNQIFTTNDAGATWTAAIGGPKSAGVSSFASHSASLVYAGTDGEGVFRSTDNGLSWSPANAGLADLSVTSLVAAQTSGTLYAGTRTGGVFKSMDGASTWIAVNNGLSNQPVLTLAVAPLNDAVAFAGTGGFFVSSVLYRTTDGGANWSVVFSSIDSLLPIALDAFLADTVYLGVCDHWGLGAFARSTDGGQNWTFINFNPANLTSCVSGVVTDPGRPGRVYLAAGDVFVTSDFGSSWSDMNDGLSSGGVYVLSMAQGSPPQLYAGQHNSSGFSSLFRTTIEPVGSCSPDATTLCLDSGRFRVDVGWVASSQGRIDAGRAIRITPNTGAFWFFDQTNLELVVKVLDGRSINGKFWVFYGSLTDVEFTLTVTDTQTGAVKAYFNPQGQLASVADTSAF
jgi:photosystem II stability/assembly factor-like uncharacterized protein